MAAAPDNKYPQKYTPEMIRDLCDSILDFAEEEGTVHFVNWSRRHKKSSSWVNEVAKDYPEFAQAYRDAKEMMAAKLVRSSIYGNPNYPNFNGTHAMSWMGVYSQEWRDYLKYKADIQKEQLAQDQNKCVFNEWKESQKKENG